MKTYYISQGLFKPALEVKIEGSPPCLFCGVLVSDPSMDGPLVCGSCDCGRNPDGSRWTDEERERAWSHRREQIAKYREASNGMQRGFSVTRERPVDYVAALDAETIATMPAPGTPIPAERCLNCGRDSGGAWSQCEGRCPHPLSPHFDPLFRARMIAAARAIDANPPTHRWDFATAEAVKLTPTGEDDPSGKRVRLDE
jgi:hypothetical protein